VLQIRGFPVDLSTVDVMSSTAEWLLECGGLTVGARGGADVDICGQGQALAVQLRTAATAHVQASGCTPAGCGPACALAVHDGGPAACRLAVRLADDAAATRPRDPARSALRFTQAVRAASSAVFACRRHAHPAGECWFGEPGADLCGDVLAVAHRLGA
jgi:hypothetical protein